MGRSSKKSDVAAATSPVVKSEKKRGNKRDVEEEIEKKLDLEKKNKSKTNNEKVESTDEPVTPCTSQVQSTVTSKTVVGLILAYGINKFDVIDFFKQAGETVDVGLRFSHQDGLFRGVGHIEFATAEAAKKALKLNGHELFGRSIILNPEVASTGASKTLVAKNLSFSITKSNVIEFFEQAGEVLDVRFSYNNNGFFKGIGFIEFATEQAAKNAVELNEQILLGRLFSLALFEKPFLSEVLILLLESTRSGAS
ncbi:hypothetical protein MKX01_025424 [Papaver californicum]|nr:hypothetical protein MKX01_025424 [Papaver californicum]